MIDGAIGRRKDGERTAKGPRVKKWAKKKGCISATLLKFGSTSWIRTKDPMINSHLLYQLS